MDNEQERNEHFKGFAELLLNDLKPDMTALFIASGSPLSSRDEEIESAQRLLMLKVAQRVYDLAYHVLYETGSGMERVFGIPYKLEQVSDLTEWPKPQ